MATSKWELLLENQPLWKLPCPAARAVITRLNVLYLKFSMCRRSAAASFVLTSRHMASVGDSSLRSPRSERPGAGGASAAEGGERGVDAAYLKIRRRWNRWEVSPAARRTRRESSCGGPGTGSGL